MALVCTHGRHDVCCAVRGRPVAAALAAAATGWDVWECSHVGGDRFAANVLLVPSGELFGSLDEATAVVGGRARSTTAASTWPTTGGGTAGRLVEQAAEHHLRVALGRGPAGRRAAPAHQGDQPRWTVDLEAAGRRRRVVLVARWSEPALLTCSAGRPDRVRLLEPERVDDLGPA